MEDLALYALYAIILFAASMLGAYLPFIKKLTDDQGHLMVAFSAGIFLGILFFLLLPEAISEAVVHEGRGASDVCITIMAGFFLILLTDILVRHLHMENCECECQDDDHKHDIASFSAFIGLAIHACVDGLVLATGLLAGEEIGKLTLIGMCIHKIVVLFSLSSTFMLTDIPRRRSFMFLTAFALISPISAGISISILNGMSIDGMVGLPLAFAAGTFMYVALCDMLPEAFHRENLDLKSLVAIVIGIAIAAAVFLVIGE
jgi:zinc transporter ZupT